ncbi:tRNA (guanosine(46)-N7)-methyltransferase TrmB [Enterobacteriaceae endosymbiont of Donacia sparganii]|uniref:tRNA (guanosine(46)-N7)-methyltransferase TrmB n=1 Tax=Enterobacteriaceae endosymbiont of Donacia sparganii TaxID=2675785 RepID=UPI0014490912|nr:tRNA (guanosine(46)-N7)-methyltransferase TrmB [Enterobacteriaceae endosymbiont of Donacia sparganii]QJC35759.1 tRNA (guanosine(46)-N7)-methyltransferase TrmB [Enterobacteriaceae endosymbiont of Donacia sparganii]
MNNIKSFCCRYRKIKKSQKIIFNNFFNLYNINYQHKILNFENIFYNKLPIIIDIGFGIGNNIIDCVIKNMQYNFIGIEVYLPGIINCLKKIIVNKIKNLKLIYHDAYFVIKNMIPNCSIKLIQLYFPDPWPKLKHKKRRLLKKDFLKIIFLKLINKGLLYIITDSKDYKNNILSDIKDISNNNFFFIKSNQYNNSYSNFDSYLFNTKFFNKVKMQKKNIYHIEYQKIILNENF